MPQDLDKKDSLLLKTVHKTQYGTVGCWTNQKNDGMLHEECAMKRMVKKRRKQKTQRKKKKRAKRGK